MLQQRHSRCAAGSRVGAESRCVMRAAAPQSRHFSRTPVLPSAERLLRSKPCRASAQEEQGQQAAVAPAPPQGPWSDAERSLLWDSVPRCLLKLGKAGPHETHFRSLKDMLDAHVLVKIQLNAEPSGVLALAQQLAAACQATLVQVEGRTMLLAQGSKAPAQIVESAQESLTKIRAYHMKRKNRGAPLEEQEGRAQPSGSGLPAQEGREQRGAGDRAGPGANGRAVGGRGPASGRDGRQQRPAGEGSGLDWRQRPTGEGAGARQRPSSGEARRGPGSGEPRPRPGADAGGGRQRPGAGAAPPRPAPAGPSIESLIASTATKGSLSKETLQQEWVALAEQIRRQEAQEFGGGKRSASRPGPGPAPAPSSPSAPSHRRASKAPWRKPAAP